MYKKILVALDHSHADDALLPHITQLARLTGGELMLLHVATGWVSHWGKHFNVEESEETRDDSAYLERTAQRLRDDGFTVSTFLTLGNPHQEILKVVRAEGCDLIAMTTHGHRFLYDVLIGSTIEKVRHDADVPLLIVRAESLKP